MKMYDPLNRYDIKQYTLNGMIFFSKEIELIIVKHFSHHILHVHKFLQFSVESVWDVCYPCQIIMKFLNKHSIHNIDLLCCATFSTAILTNGFASDEVLSQDNLEKILQIHKEPLILTNNSSTK